MAERNKKPETVEDKNNVKKDRIYLCPTKSGQTFYVPVRNEDGKQIPKTNNLGQQIVIGNKAQFVEQMLHFTPLPTKLGQEPVCKYELSKDDSQYDDKFAALEAMRLDRASWVMNKDDFEKWKNPEAAKYVIENEKLRAQNADKDRLIEGKDQTIESMKKQLAELQKQDNGKGK